MIIPVFNRPDDIGALLGSIAAQSCRDFEVIIVEDGSTLPAGEIVKQFAECFPLQYYCIPNSGPGPARNYGCTHANGEYLLFVDSDCLLPPPYLEMIRRHLATAPLDAFGGPDAAHPSFTPLQKAISYAMTSIFTTGGIRGRKARFGIFHPRSFNMGIARKVYEQTQGFSAMRFGEDIELSIRILQQGFKTGLIPEAWVYHKRREDLWQFFKQVHNSGIARINLYKRHPQSFELVHCFPAVFTLGCASVPVWGLLSPSLFLFFSGLFVLYATLVFSDAAARTKSLTVASLSTAAAYVQLIGYGSGFLRAVWHRLVRGYPEFSAFRRNFSD